MRIARIRSLEVDCVCCVATNAGEFRKILPIVRAGGVGVGCGDGHAGCSSGDAVKQCREWVARCSFWFQFG